MIHRALLGSLERFFGILIEHYEGLFPLWLTPIQLNILTVNKNVTDYSQKISKKLKNKGFRVNCDDSNEKIGFKIRESINQKIPLLAIIGDKEKEENYITIRNKKENIGTFTLEELEAYLSKEIQAKN